MNNPGFEIYSFIEELFPVCRSITGNGTRETLKNIQARIPIKIEEVKSGENVFDWEIPNEWNINDAYVINPEGKKIIDFKKSNLHVLNYSIPVNKKVNLNELKKHLYTLPDQPDLIPYRTSYYKKDWGFCIAYNEFRKLKDGDYQVVIDSSLKPGSLTYGELYIPGEKSDEVLISTHICHPSLCNDNLSGIAISTYLAHTMLQSKPYYSYRFVFIPGTIGSITWLSMNEKNVSKIKYGLVITLLGDKSGFTYKRSRIGNANIDRIVEHYFKLNQISLETRNFSPYGYDERQYCSPGFNLPVGCLTRKPFSEFPEYHTSADNLDFVRPKYLEESFNHLLQIINLIDNNKKYLNLNPKCEPQLGKRGLYEQIGGDSDSRLTQMAALWVLNLSDGENDVIDITQKSGIKIEIIRKAITGLLKCNLLKEI